jgi:asparagine synthase (glutamine-hydrolysing)
MCGIAGIFNLDSAPISQRAIKAMTDILAHRGPDGEGHYLDLNLALGHRRLAIIDLSPAGNQPMASEDGQVVVSYNGEIYNFLQLRLELEARGHRFRSRTDTEVLIHGFEEYGIDFILRLNGMFAFALWDARNRRLYLVRDRYGIKPLYYYIASQKLVFASEIKAILTHPQISIDLNYDALNEYFTFQNLFRYHTLFKGIFLLPAANIATISEAEPTMSLRCYWDYNFTDRFRDLSFAEAQEEILRLFKQAVVRQLISDVPVGSYLSGGMDSGSIVAVVSQEIPRLATFTGGFEMTGVDGHEANTDERQDAELMAFVFNTEHYEQVMHAGDIGWVLPSLVYHLEDLRVGMSYPNYYIARLASRFVKVCLSGAGGDELFGGYPWRYYRVCRALDREEYFQEYYQFWQRLVPDVDKPLLFTANAWQQVNDRNMLEVFRRVFTFNPHLKYDSPEEHIANSLYFEIKNFLHALFIVGDKLSMAHSLEERVPFMDNDLVEFAQRVPIRYKLANLEEIKKLDENELAKRKQYYHQHDDGKNILRQAMSNLIPEAIINRKKQGFSAPDESWYRGANLEYVVKTLRHPRAAYRDFINPHYVDKIITEHCDRRINHRLLIWSLLSFEQWCRIFLDGQSLGREASPISGRIIPNIS